MLKKIIGLALVVILLALGGYFGYKSLKNGNNGKRQAVFLSNGQVYFGYLAGSSSQFIKLKDVYYLRTEDLAGQADEKKKILLVKMGNELHRPEGDVYLNRDQILFYQTIKDESKINEAIAKFAEKQNVEQAQNQTATPVPAIQQPAQSAQ